MTKFASKDLAELAHQLLLSPKRKRLTQIKGIEALLRIVEPEKSYPYDMVCYHITGYRNRRQPTKATISGEKLMGDLVALAEHVTRRTAVAVAELDEPHRSYVELAQDLEVSTKTIRRWRRHGLMGFRAACDDGVSRLVYLQSTIDRFVEQNKALVKRGAAFRQLTSREKEQIVQLAEELVGNRRMKLHVVAREIAQRTGRAVETIRYTLRRHDQAHPDRALFNGSGLPSAPELHRRVWEALERGDSTGSIQAVFDLTPVELERVIRQMKARQFKADPLSYIHNELFDAPNADALILDAPRPTADPSKKRTEPPKDLPAYLRSLYTVSLMSADQEVDAFRRYNYLKHKAARLIEAIDVNDVSQVELDTVADLTAQFEGIRQEILRANLRLVVSIAKKHVGWSPQFFEVISDGNMSLIRAVEKFDYSRGFKFSTYASWAIMKNYARTIPEQRYHFSRYVTGQEELLASAADYRAPKESNLEAQKLSEALKEGMHNLTERERSIVTSHYGLFGTGPSVTLEDLGRRFGVTKERIRQIERRAISKMKTALSPTLVDMLPE